MVLNWSNQHNCSYLKSQLKNLGYTIYILNYRSICVHNSYDLLRYDLDHTKFNVARVTSNIPPEKRADLYLYGYNFIILVKDSEYNEETLIKMCYQYSAWHSKWT